MCSPAAVGCRTDLGHHRKKLGVSFLSDSAPERDNLRVHRQHFYVMFQ
jgi:hypothetical protein